MHLLPKLALTLPAALLLGCHPTPSVQASTITTLTITAQTLHPNVKRFGINLSGQGFYDSGQMLSNLIARNPGFEGETWQTILRCKQASTTTCTEDNQYTVWPAGFLNGAHYEIVSGPAKGATGTVQASTANHPPDGITMTLTPLPVSAQKGDFLIIRMDKPGAAEAGWWLNPSPGAKFSTELQDLSPRTQGKQALRIEASAPGQNLTLNSYFDTLDGHSFVQLHGLYRLQFRAKPLAGTKPLEIRLQRLDTTHGMETFFSKDISLAQGWHDYTFDFPTHEDGTPIGGVVLGFSVRESSLLLDDVSLTPAAPAPTAFRDEVVSTLRDLHPGVLRYMDNGGNFGSSLDTLLTPALARRRTGSSTQAVLMEDVSIGLHEFLTLCKAIGAEPWFVMPPGFTPAESSALIEYLSGPATTPYGARRAALGQAKPWSEVFPVLHLELGNEQWNARSFAGQTISDPTLYAERANDVFSSARHSPYFQAKSYDLILGTWSAVPWWTGEELKANTQADSTAIAPYLFSEFNDGGIPESIFGPMFAQPEQADSRNPTAAEIKHNPSTGIVQQQLAATRKAAHPVSLAVYEVNLGSMTGTASQQALNDAVPSLGAGLAVADHMLLMLRDAGITTQAFFALPEYVNNFTSPDGQKKTMPLWGAVVDMGGATNLRRPQFLTVQLANQTMLPTMLKADLTGPNPTWSQTLSPNDKIELPEAHDLQTFAFADGKRRSLILFNLDRSEPHTLVFAGPNSPQGKVTQTQITSPNLTDNNETKPLITPQTQTLPTFNPTHPYTLPAHSMTTLTWTQP